MTGTEELGKSLYEIQQRMVMKHNPELSWFDPWEDVEDTDKEIFKDTASEFLARNAQAV